MGTETTVRCTPLRLTALSEGLILVVVRQLITTSALPHVMSRQLHRAAAGNTVPAIALRRKLKGITLASRDALTKAHADLDDEIARVLDPSIRKRLLARKATLKAAPGAVSQQARAAARPLMCVDSRGAGKGGEKIGADQVDAVRAEIYANPDLVFSKYRSHVFSAGVTGKTACWQVGSASDRRLHPDLQGRSVSDWLTTWPKAKGRAAVRSFKARIDQIFDSTSNDMGTPLRDPTVDYGVHGEVASAAFVEFSCRSAATQTQKHNQRQVNAARKGEADDLEIKYARCPEWELIQQLEDELDTTHRNSGSEPKEPYQISFHHLGGQKQLFQRLRSGLARNATTTDLIEIVRRYQERRPRLYARLFELLCSQRYWCLWDTRALPDPDDAKANWVLARAEYVDACRRHRAPATTHPHFVLHPVWPLYRTTPVNSCKMSICLDSRTIEIDDLWRGRSSRVSAQFLKNGQLESRPPANTKKRATHCYYYEGGPNQRRRHEATLTSLRLRLDAYPAYARLSGSHRALLSSGAELSAEQIDDLARAFVAVFDPEVTPIYMIAHLDLEVPKVKKDVALRQLRKHLREDSDGTEIRACCATLEGSYIQGVDSGVANSGGRAYLKFVGPNHPAKPGDQVAPISGEYGLCVVESSVLYLEGERTEPTLDECRVVALYRDAITVLSLQHEVVNLLRIGRGTEAPNRVRAQLEEQPLDELRTDAKVIQHLTAAVASGEVISCARTLELANRRIHKVIKLDRGRLAAERRERHHQGDHLPVLGGKSARRLHLLELELEYLRLYEKCDFVSRGGTPRDGRRQGIDDLPHIAERRKRFNNLRRDRVQQHVALCQGGPFPTIATVREDLDSFRFSVGQSRGTNKRLATWSHRRIDEAQQAKCELTGEGYLTINAAYTSQLLAIDGAPGIRMSRVPRGTINVYQQRDIDKVPYPLSEGDLYPCRGGKWFAAIDAKGQLIVAEAEANAAINIAHRAVSARSEPLSIMLVCPPGDALAYEPSTGKVYQRCGSLRGDATFRALRLPPLKTEERDKGPRVDLRRDPVGRYLDTRDWVSPRAYWQEIEARVLYALYSSRIRIAAE